MNIAILGFGAQGRSAYEYWRNGNEITICDQTLPDNLPADVQKKIGNHNLHDSEQSDLILRPQAIDARSNDYLHDLDQFDLIVRSPSIHPRDIATANSEAILEKVTTNTNEFFRVCPTKNIIGITGTKGKGTTSSLIAKILEAAGKRVHLGGNIGIPPLELLQKGIQPEDYVVLELANFQLIDLQYSPHIAVCLMVAPEHMDWHADVAEYYGAKSQLFAQQTAEDMAIYYADNEHSKAIASHGKARKIPYFAPPGALVTDGNIVIDGQILCKTEELKLLGKHNWQNVCAAVTAAWEVTQDTAALRNVLTSFSGLPHRLEFVTEVHNVKYYDDSFGTTPETATVAIQAFEAPKVLIVGGSDKGASFDELGKVIAANSVKHIIAIGQMRSKILEAVDKAGGNGIPRTEFDTTATMQQIVEAAQYVASPGDVVLLSTACASFDMFKNYKVRGEQFKQAVQSLGPTAG